MISYNDALNIIYEHCWAFPSRVVPLPSANGHVAAEDICGRLSIPSFDNSAMDGYAFAFDQVDHTVEIPVLGRIAAGDTQAAVPSSGCVFINTGAVLPEWADTVIPIENVSYDETRQSIRITKTVPRGANIRRAGEDFSAGDVICKAGQAITPEIMMALAAHGIAHIPVFDIPTIHILSTGSELMDVGAAQLENGKIFNSSAYYLLGASQEQGLDVVYHGIYADNPEKVREKIQDIEPNSIIITTGAVSMGEWDFIPGLLKDLSAEIGFHKVAIRPGKPVLFATLGKQKAFFGLPGNPVSTIIGFTFFVEAFLRAGCRLPKPTPSLAMAKGTFHKKNTLKQFLKAQLTSKDGQLLADVATGQESFKVNALLHTDTWVMLDEDTHDIVTGDVVYCHDYRRHFAE